MAEYNWSNLLIQSTDMDPLIKERFKVFCEEGDKLNKTGAMRWWKSAHCNDITISEQLVDAAFEASAIHG